MGAGSIDLAPWGSGKQNQSLGNLLCSFRHLLEVSL